MTNSDLLTSSNCSQPGSWSTVAKSNSFHHQSQRFGGGKRNGRARHIHGMCKSATPGQLCIEMNQTTLVHAFPKNNKNFSLPIPIKSRISIILFRKFWNRYSVHFKMCRNKAQGDYKTQIIVSKTSWKSSALVVSQKSVLFMFSLRRIIGSSVFNVLR